MSGIKRYMQSPFIWTQDYEKGLVRDMQNVVGLRIPQARSTNQRVRDAILRDKVQSYTQRTCISLSLLTKRICPVYSAFGKMLA